MPMLMRLVFAALGLAALAASLWLRQMNRKAASWPTTTGTILSSGLEADPHDAGSVVEITYQYSVAGRKYTASRIAYTATSDSRPAKERLVSEYPAGRVVEVYYDPAHPASAALQRDPSALWLGVAATGAAFVAIAVLVP